MTKLCKTCHKHKEWGEFKKNKSCKNGVTGKCKECVNNSLKVWRELNPDHSKGNRQEVTKRYYETHKEKVLSYSSNYKQKNLHKYAFYERKREASKLNATPSWLTQEQLREIECFYELAKTYDEPMHVDHIIPLQGKDVCGLHVPWNLQLLPAIENISKGIKYNGC